MLSIATTHISGPKNPDMPPALAKFRPFTDTDVFDIYERGAKM
ncbi:hypothetical protein MED193_02920 [Roseobacter sp. MED193]|nr:hypothetical protein MED193_02920 [Roseobacter sp. MED193]